MAALAVAAATALLTTGFAPSAGAVTDRTSEHGINIENAEGERIWFGQISGDVEAASETLATLAAQHEDLTAGVSLTSDSRMIEVYVTSHGRRVLTSKMRRAVGSKFTKIVRVITVEHSTDELLRAQQSIPDATWESLNMTSVAPSVEHNGLVIGIAAPNEDSAVHGPSAEGSASGKLARRATPGPADRIDQINLDVPVRFVEGETSDPAYTRRSDAAPYYGGAEIIRNGTYCSLGFPITVGSAKYAVTAGHCGLGTFYNNGVKVGTTHTTTWTATAARYGDWQLLKGSTYGMSVYNGAVTSSSSLRISRGNYGSRANGSALCTSGRTTGQICRYRVKDSHVTKRARVSETQTTKVGYLTELISDPNDDGVGTCTGFKSGDSGGPAYYADTSTPGSVVVLGVIHGETASEISKSGGKCSSARYYISELKGVRAWNSNATVGN